MGTVAGRMRHTFYAPLRRFVTALWLLGAATALVTLPVAGQRVGLVEAIPYAIIGALLIGLAVAVSRQITAALVVSTVLLGAQLFAVVGRAWELSHGIDEAKSHQLAELGIDPTVAISANLAFSTASVVLFAWAAIRWSKYRNPLDHAESQR